jgi:multiple sugar transport system substrate-binding protein
VKPKVLVTMCLFLSGCSDGGPLRVWVVDGPVGAAFESIARGKDISVTPLLYEEMQERVISELGKNPPSVDIVMLDDPWIPVFASQLAPIEIGAAGKKFLPLSLELAGYRGKTYAVPFLGNAQVLFYNENLVNVTLASWEDVARAAAQVKAQGKAFGFALRAGYGQGLFADYLPLLWARGGNLNPDQSQILTRPEAVKALDLMKLLSNFGPASQFGFSAAELRIHFAIHRSAMGIHWLASSGMLDPETEWTPLPDSSPAVFSTWLLAYPSNLPPARKERARQFLMSLVENSSAPSASNYFWQAANEAKAISVIPYLDDCPSGHIKTIARKRKGACVSIPVEVRPRTNQWLKIEKNMSRAISSALTNLVPPDQALDDALHAIDHQ